MELPEQACEVCGKAFRPYRLPYRTKDGRLKASRVCSPYCHRRLPDIRATTFRWNAIPEHKEKKNAARRIANNPARREVNLRSLLKVRYGMSLEDYLTLVAAQGGRCYLCGHVPFGNKSASRLTVDHNHTTGAIRRLLCNGCNRGLGYLQDDPVLLRKAAAYIEAHAA